MAAARELMEENFQTAPDIAYQIISQKILDGEFKPGMRLSRRKMAEVTNVSVIPVIEALKRLEEDRLVESRPKWGSFVTIPTVEKVTEAIEAREAIECQTARLLSQRITDEQKYFLMKLAEDLDTIPYHDETAVESRERHLRFHRNLAEFSGNEFLARTLDRVNLFWILCNALVEKAPNVQYPRYHHRKLMDDICSGDPEKAERTMRDHILDSKDLVIESARKKSASIH